MTLWKLVGTRNIAEVAKALMVETGATVELHTEEQSEEQSAERRHLLGIE